MTTNQQIPPQQPSNHLGFLQYHPSTGSIAGGQVVTIKGSAFTYAKLLTTVKFGLVELSGSSITFVDQFTNRVNSPSAVIGPSVPLSVHTPMATSNAAIYTYLALTPITFNANVLTLDIAAPTKAAFVTDGRPGGTGAVDIVVEGGNKQRYTFQRGYRYITGLSSNDDD
jgi:IPT/TIG domain